MTAHWGKPQRGRVHVLVARELFESAFVTGTQHHIRVDEGIPAGACLVSVGPADRLVFGADLVDLIFEHDSFAVGGRVVSSPKVTRLDCSPAEVLKAEGA